LYVHFKANTRTITSVGWRGASSLAGVTPGKKAIE